MILCLICSQIDEYVVVIDQLEAEIKREETQTKLRMKAGGPDAPVSRSGSPLRSDREQGARKVRILI